MIDSETLFVLYLIAVRLGTITAGVIVIRYGYRLFAAGVFKSSTGGSNTEIAGRIGDYEFKFKTAAPGAILGIYGAVIISLAIAAAPPELTRGKKVTHKEEGSSRTTTIETTERMRSEIIELSQLIAEASEHKNEGQTAEAIQKYQKSIRIIARPINELALLYKETDRLEDAMNLAEVAVMMSPSDPDFNITLEEIMNAMEKE